MITILSEHHIKLGDTDYFIRKANVSLGCRYEVLRIQGDIEQTFIATYSFKGSFFLSIRSNYRPFLRTLIEYLKVERTLNQKLDKKI